MQQDRGHILDTNTRRQAQPDAARRRTGLIIRRSSLLQKRDNRLCINELRAGSEMRRSQTQKVPENSKTGKVLWPSRVRIPPSPLSSNNLPARAVTSEPTPSAFPGGLKPGLGPYGTCPEGHGVRHVFQDESQRVYTLRPSPRFNAPGKHHPVASRDRSGCRRQPSGTSDPLWNTHRSRNRQPVSLGVTLRQGLPHKRVLSGGGERLGHRQVTLYVEARRDWLLGWRGARRDPYWVGWRGLASNDARHSQVGLIAVPSRSCSPERLSNVRGFARGRGRKLGPARSTEPLGP